MFMARPPHEHKFRRGSLTGPTQQLPSFSHFLSGVQQSENNVPYLRSDSFSQQPEAPGAFRRDLFNPRNDPSRPQSNPDISLPHSTQHVPQQQSGRHTLLGQGTYSPTHSDQQRSNRLPRPHPYRPHLEVQSSNEPLPIVPAQGDGGPTKTVLRETNIDGKGLCYVYDDGSVCPKAVNGDVVNPKWGTTKAGKPRKRLGQACNTCREKKIRCDPQIPKCAQCQKFGRECKFETGGRGSQKGSSSSARESPTTPELKKDTGHDRHGSSVSAETLSEQLYSRENSRSSINVESLLSPSSTVISEEAPPFKKRKVSMSPKDMSDSLQPLRRPSTPDRLIKTNIQPQPELQFSVDTNPLSVDKRLTLRYVHQYMNNVNSKLYHILPTSTFLRWVEDGSVGNSSDLLVMYAIMAFSTTYSGNDDPNRTEDGRIFTRIAEDIFKHQQMGNNFQCVLAQLVLSFRALSEGDFGKSQNLTANTLQICCQMGLNTEDGLSHLASQGMPCFGFDVEMAKECMRRVFWLAYVGNSFYKYCLQERRDDDALRCTLRLPCDDASYDAGLVPSLPVYHMGVPDKDDLSLTSGHGMIAFLVEIATVLDEVTYFQHLTTPTSKQAYELFYNRMKMRLSGWEKKMKKHLSGLQQTEIAAGYAGTPRLGSAEEPSSVGTSGLHLLHHFVALVLHRHVAWQQLSTDKVERCVRESYNLAVQTLELVQRLDEDGGTTIPFARMARSCPIASLAVFAAADVITAAGAISEVLEHQHEGRGQNFKEMVSCAIRALEDLSRYWRTAEKQSKLVQGRLKPILSLSQANTKKAFFFRTPLYSPFGLDRDVVYGPSRMDYFRALGLGDRIRGDSDMMEMGVQSPR